MDEGSLIVLIVFASIAIVAFIAFHFSYKRRTVVYDTIKIAIEKTGTADAALIEAIVRDNVGPNADLRKGIILVAVAAAFAILGLQVDEADAVGPMLGVASFPGLVGLAYIGFHFFAPREPTV